MRPPELGSLWRKKRTENDFVLVIEVHMPRKNFYYNPRVTWTIKVYSLLRQRVESLDGFEITGYNLIQSGEENHEP